LAVSRQPRFGFLLLVAIVATACGSASASFDPTSACTTDGHQPGAYPVLEARIPTTYLGTGTGEAGLGSQLHPGQPRVAGAAGFSETASPAGPDVRRRAGGRAGGVHRQGPDGRQDGRLLHAERQGRSRTTVTAESAPTLAGRPGRRLDTTTGSRLQIVVVWPAADPDFVNVVISNDLPDARIDDAIAAYGGH
jgi:hypothetical protein